MARTRKDNNLAYMNGGARASNQLYSHTSATVSSNESSSSTKSRSNNSVPKPTKHGIIKSGWGDRNNFMLSYGLKPYDMDDQKEADAILEILVKNEVEDWKEAQKCNPAK
ncbi:MAG: hypothetical protein M1818_001249 [Claussenomyces sp. TS43310]|nr:MAG: hypothetical protein M1818_001249 [Claussenomyces sp. TS43310]